MKTVQISIYAWLCATILGIGISLTSCNDDAFNGEIPNATGAMKGYLTIDFNINGTPLSRSTKAGEASNIEANEDAIMEVDLFFYTNDNTPAIYSYHNTVGEGNIINLEFSSLPQTLQDGTPFRIVAIVNCEDDIVDTQFQSDFPTIEELKALTTQVAPAGAANSGHRTFRGEDAPQAFVMTNLMQNVAGENAQLKVDEENGTVATIQLKRVAAKIRVDLAVNESVMDEDGEWKPDTENMRLYFSNGVRTARLDGDISNMTFTEDDYFNITTTGNKVDDTSDYLYARHFGKHDPAADDDNTPAYIYANEIPHYTYPTAWGESMTETHQPMLTIVIPWEKTEGDNKIYQPTYYSTPVNKAGKIVSNAYYYIRAHIGMKGSTTPELPMPVDIESEILDWGTSQQIDVDLKPIRFLIFNQTDYTINNETSWTVPFMTTHSCVITDCKIWVYGYNEDDKFGEESVVVIDDETTYNNVKIKGELSNNNHLYNYTLNNADNTLTFEHRLFAAKFYLPESGTAAAQRQNFFSTATSNTTYNENVTDWKGRTYIRKKVIATGSKRLYAHFDVELTVRHEDKQNENDTPYQETVILRFYPNIYMSSETIDRAGGLNTHDGWILVNGYGTRDADTGKLKEVDGREGNSGDQRGLLTFTITQLNEEDKAKWILDDPRTLYINNELADGKMTDVADNLTRWSNGNYGGPYDGTQRSGGTTATNRHAVTNNGLKTMWEYYPREDDYPDWMIQWSATEDVWNAKEDYWSDVSGTPQYHRTLSYYYPANESLDKAKVIAPKFTIVSYHAFASSGDETKQTARRRCAAYQQYGYPAGRWRLPTHAEIQYIKQLQKNGTILDVFGGSNNWSAQGRVNSDGELSTTASSAYTRCVYDNWYWEQVDANGTAYNRIPDDDGTHASWKIFHWGDRPKENPLLTGAANAPTVQNFLRKATANK